MVRSETGAAGVMFTMDTESGFREVVFITAAYGLGETVVQGAVNPDEFYVHKPTLEAGRPAVLRRTRGSKLIKMVYADSSKPGRSVQTVDVETAHCRQFCVPMLKSGISPAALIIEKRYGRPMDIEWARDGDDGQLYIVQARPETVQSQQDGRQMERFVLKGKGSVLVEVEPLAKRSVKGPSVW